MRRPDWRARLAAYIDRCRRRQFSPGSHDCATFAAGAVEAMTGEDPAAEFRGRYASEARGLRLVRRAGYIDHVDLARANWREVPVAMAQAGDLAVVPVGPLPALGVVQGARVFLVGEEGLMTVDLLEASAAFQV